MLDLLKDPLVQKLIIGGCGTALGFALKWLLPSYKRVVDGDVSRLEKDYQAALRAEEKAHATPSKDDDPGAEAKAAAAKRVLEAKQRLKEALDGFGAPK